MVLRKSLWKYSLITILALSLVAVPFFLSFVIMISVLLTFIIRSTLDQSAHKTLNTIVGIWIYFGTFLMVVSLTLMLEGLGPSYQVSWMI